MTEGQQTSPPVARKVHTEAVLHGVTLTDDYTWLRDKQDPEVTAYLEAENAYAEAVISPLAGLRDKLYEEMLSHVKQTDISVPFRDGNWWYYTRTEEGRQYAIHCRKPAIPVANTPGAPGPGSPRTGPRPWGGDPSQLGTWEGSIPGGDLPEEILLDGNQLAEGHPFFAIGATDITDDGRWLAYTTDTTGFRQYTLHIKDLATGETFPGQPSPSPLDRVGSVQWAADNATLFYTVEDEEQKRQFQLWRHTRGLRQATSDHSADVLVFQDDDERFNLGVGRTGDGKYLVLESASHITTEARVLDAGNPNGDFTVLIARRDEHEYSIDHRNGHWYIRTNDMGRNFRLVAAPVAAPQFANWIELIPHRLDVMLEEVDLFQDFYVAGEREDGLPRLRIARFPGAGPEADSAGEIAFPEPAYSAHPHVNRIFDTSTFRYAYQSLVTPASIYEYDVASRTSTLLKQLEVPGGFDRTLYASARVHATAPDGVKVPVSLVYRKDSRKPGNNPLYVYGYGS